MDWSSFHRKIRIVAPINDVYLAWSDRHRIVKWFLATCEPIESAHTGPDIQKGDTVEWSWHNYPNHSPITIIEANGSDHIAFTFGHGMEVSIHLTVEGKFTVIDLHQYNIPTDEADKQHFNIGCRQAWSTWLLNLKAWLEHGITLHDTHLGKREDLFDFVNT